MRCCGCSASVADDGQSVLLVTHDAEASALADRVLTLRDGRLAGEAAAGRGAWRGCAAAAAGRCWQPPASPPRRR